MTVKQYDITLDGHGYMLAEGGALTSAIATPLAPKTVSGDHGMADFEPYSFLAQTDLRAGLGQLLMDDATAYLWGHRIDARGERVTLGPKVDSTEKTSDDGSGTVGEMAINGIALNRALGDEPENQTRAWQILDTTTPKLAIPFRTPGGAAASFLPSDLSGLKLWLKADAGVYQDSAGTTPVASDNDPVGKWTDQSGTGNHYTQATSGARPSWQTNEQNSLPTVKGDGSNDYLAGNAPVTGGGNRTIFIVVKPDTTASEKYWADFGNNSASGKDYRIGNAAASKFGVKVEDGNRLFTTAVSTAAYHIVTVRQSGSSTTNIDAWVDGAALTVSSTTSRTINTANNGRLFANYTGTLFSACLIGEVIVYDSALSATDRQQVEDYLGTRWNLSAGSGSSTTLHRLWAYIRSTTGVSASTVALAVHANSGGDPNATAITNGTASAASTISTEGEWIPFRFSTPPTVTPDTDYWMVLSTTGTSGESIDCLTATVTTSTPAKSYDGSSWTALTNTMAAMTGQYHATYPDTPVTKFIEWGTSMYMLAGRRIYKSTAADVIALTGKEMAADITDAILVQKPGDAAAKMLVAMGTASDAEYWDGVSTWTILTGIKADKFCIHDNIFWRATSGDVTNGVFVQGVAAYTSWATGNKVSVGDSRFPIAALFSWKSQLYACKRDGIWVITYPDTYPASGTPQATKLLDLTSEAHPNNWAGWAIWQDDLFFSLANGVARFSSSNVIGSVTPDASLLTQAQTRGKFTAMAATLNQLYVAYESDVDDWSQVLAYGNGWHSLLTSDRTGDPVRALGVDSGLYNGYPRLWLSWHSVVASAAMPTWSLRRWTFATGDASSPIQFFARSSTVLDDCDGRLYTSWFDGGLTTIPKKWLDLEVLAANLDANTTITVYYRAEEGDAWTSLGACTTDSTTLTFPTAFAGRRVQLRFDLHTEAAYLTPHLLGYALRYIARPDTKERFQIQVKLAEGMELHNGAEEQRTMAEQWQDLKDARESTASIAYVDIEGVSTLVNIEQLSRQLTRRRGRSKSQFLDSYVATIVAVEA